MNLHLRIGIIIAGSIALFGTTMFLAGMFFSAGGMITGIVFTIISLTIFFAFIAWTSRLIDAGLKGGALGIMHYVDGVDK